MNLMGPIGPIVGPYRHHITGPKEPTIKPTQVHRVVWCPSALQFRLYAAEATLLGRFDLFQRELEVLALESYELCLDPIASIFKPS